MEQYATWTKNISLFESNEHYQNLMCLKDISKTKIRTDNSIELKFVIDSNILPERNNLLKKCVLLKGHKGQCSTNFNIIFKKDKTIEKLLSSVHLSIYSTPGNDDYVYKNRCSRLYPIVLSKMEEKKIRDKNIKKKCAIPLKDASTPILLAQSYLDWMTFIFNVKNIKKYFKKSHIMFYSIQKILNENKKYLISLYKNREIFNKDGHSICVITRNLINIKDISDISRDNRVKVNDNDIQLGHNQPRNDDYVSIRGGNLLPMSRRGNLIIGEKIFSERIWIDELKYILSIYS
jgi:hypothetical protein